MTRGGGAPGAPHRGDRQRWEGWGMINDCPKGAKQRCHIAHKTKKTVSILIHAPPMLSSSIQLYCKIKKIHKSHSKPIKNPLGVEFHIQPPSTPRFKTGLTGPFCTKVEAADTAQPEA